MGPTPEESLLKAGALRERLRLGLPEDLAQSPRGDPELPDTLRALCRLLEPCQADRSQAAHDLLARAYELVAGLEWEDEVGERDEVLAQLSFIAWNHSRRYFRFPETERWQQICVSHATAQEQVQDFLAVPTPRHSEDLRVRFLSDPVVLLAACESLARKQNESPAAAAEEGAELYRWLLDQESFIAPDQETVRYFVGSIASAVTVALGYLGRGRVWEDWYRRASTQLEQTIGNAPWLESLSFARLIRLYGARRYREVVDKVGGLIDRFEDLSMTLKALRARFLHALCLKELGRSSEALALLATVREGAAARSDSMTAAHALGAAAQLHDEAGSLELAKCELGEATMHAVRSGCPATIAWCAGTMGELLRNRGDYPAAITAYRSCVSTYDEAAMESLSAYMRIVLSETLLLAGREAEALAEILLALPVIDREGMSEEATAAVDLLREAVRRHRANPEALRVLREQLTRMKQDGGL